MIYFGCFALSAGIIGLTERQKKSTRIAGIAAAFLLLILLATLRAETVGIDVYTYMKPLYLCSVRSGGLGEFFKNMAVDPDLKYLDYGYALTGYAASKIFGGLWGIFFVNEVLCLVPVALGISAFNAYFKKTGRSLYIPYWAALFLYLCLFYNNSLNQVRQIIVCGFLFYGFALLLNKKYFACFFWFVLSCTFHVSSIIFLYFLLIYYLTKNRKTGLSVCLVAVLIAFLFFGVQLFGLAMKVLNLLNLVPEKYYNEIFMSQTDSLNINLCWLFICIAMLGISFLHCHYNRSDYFYKFLFLVSFSFLALFNVSSNYYSFGRIQLYFMIYAIIIIPSVSQVINGKNTGATVASAVSVAVGLIYWIVAVLLLDYTGTIPYSFAF